VTAIDSIEAYVPDALNPMQRTISSSSSISSASSSDSFASAEDFGTTREGLPANDSVATSQDAIDDSPHGREMQKIEDKKRQLKEKLDQAQEKQNQDLANESNKTQKEMEKAAEKHTKERKKQEDKFEREIRKLEERREKETKKLLARQQKEADKNGLLKALRERDEYKQRLDIVEEENKLLKEQIGGLQRENTALVARLGKTEFGRDVLKAVQEEDGTGRARASSRASRSSGKSGKLSESSIASIARASTEKLKG
jgi:chromosome segregation ATPase